MGTVMPAEGTCKKKAGGEWSRIPGEGKGSAKAQTQEGATRTQQGPGGWEGAGGEEAEVIPADDRAPGKPHFTRRQNGPKGSGSR